MRKQPQFIPFGWSLPIIPLLISVFLIVSFFIDWVIFLAAVTLFVSISLGTYIYVQWRPNDNQPKRKKSQPSYPVEDIDELNEPNNPKTNSQNGPGYLYRLELIGVGDESTSVLKALESKLQFSPNSALRILEEKCFPITLLESRESAARKEKQYWEYIGAKVVLVQTKTVLLPSGYGFDSNAHPGVNALRMVGYWMESLDASTDPFYPPQEFVSGNRTERREQIACYLENASPLSEFKGVSWCRFKCGIEDHAMGAGELTDGLWAWPSGLSHYVREHGIELPKDFIDHIDAGGSTLPEKISGPFPIDLQYWINWCEKQTQGLCDEKLKCARENVAQQQRTYNAAHDKMIDRLSLLKEKNLGLSHKPCQQPGCHKKALYGKAICAEHHPYQIVSDDVLQEDVEFQQIKSDFDKAKLALESQSDLSRVLNP